MSRITQEKRRIRACRGVSTVGPGSSALTIATARTKSSSWTTARLIGVNGSAAFSLSRMVSISSAVRAMRALSINERSRVARTSLTRAPSAQPNAPRLSCAARAGGRDDRIGGARLYVGAQMEFCQGRAAQLQPLVKRQRGFVAGGFQTAYERPRWREGG